MQRRPPPLASGDGAGGGEGDTWPSSGQRRRAGEGEEETGQEGQEDEEGLGFSPAPWAEGCPVKPIFVVSDCTGEGAVEMVQSGWTQFGSTDAADIVLRPGVRSTLAVDMVVEEASMCDIHWPNAGSPDQGTPCGLVVYTFASRVLSAHLVNACKQRGIMCVSAVAPLHSALEEHFGHLRPGRRESEAAGARAPGDDFQAGGNVQLGAPRVFAASCGQGNCTFNMVRAALRHYPWCGDVSHVTICPRVNSVEEVKLIVHRAATHRALVAFTFASPGLSRLVRTQCELAEVHYADLFQPVLIAMELYLDHPFFGVPGGLDLQQLAEAELRWERRAVS